MERIKAKSKCCSLWLPEIANTGNYLSIHPSAVAVGELALKNYELWKIEEPYTLASNYISPFELG